MIGAGSILGRYELVAPLGHGGMGSVWRARDTVLARDVAVKVISPSVGDRRAALARFRREAETASALNHPALVTVFEVGTAGEDDVFIAMQLIDGCNLREWLRTQRTRQDVLDVLAQAGAGLAAAHEKGVLHRDIKPENIMVTPDGFAKVVDFGLAKLVGDPAHAGNDEPTPEMITRTNAMVGTVPYMSPEQVCGDELDARSDVFSFGAVLYEAVTGRRRFAGRTTTEVVQQILDGEGTPMEQVDPPLAALIAGCLEKKREDRIGSMREVVSRLRNASRASTAVRPRVRLSRRLQIALAATATAAAVAAVLLFGYGQWRSAPLTGAVAVLPFETPDTKDAYLSSTFAAGVTTDLARQSGLSVIARDSATRFRSSFDVRKTSTELGARYLVLGNVIRAGDRFRIDAQLVDGPSRSVVWAEQYDSALAELFTVQAKIARDVATKLMPQHAHAAGATTPRDAAVTDIYLRAKFFSSDPEGAVQDKSIPLLEQVCAADPHFTPARIELAGQYARRAFAYDPDRQWEQRAFVEVEKLLREFPGESEPYRLRANLRFTRGGGWRFEEALADYDRSIRIDPNNAAAWNSRGSLLMHYGFLDEALSDYQHALRLDPFSDFAKFRIPRVHAYQGKYDQAAEEWRAAGVRHGEVAVALEAGGHADEAMKAAEDAREKADNVDTRAAFALLFARRGDRQRAAAEIARVEPMGEASSHFHHAAYSIAEAYAQMGDAPNAVKWLERVARDGMPCHPLFANDVLLDPVRNSAEFRAFFDRSRLDYERRRRERYARSG